MELGAPICLPQKSNLLMSASYHLRISKNNTLAARPIKKPNETRSLGLEYIRCREKWKNLTLQIPQSIFQKTNGFLPGTAKKVAKAPKTYHFRHSITHHDIFRDR